MPPSCFWMQFTMSKWQYTGAIATYIAPPSIGVAQALAA